MFSGDAALCTRHLWMSRIGALQILFDTYFADYFPAEHEFRRSLLPARR